MEINNNKGGDSTHHLTAPIYNNVDYIDKNVLKHAQIYVRTQLKKMKKEEESKKKKKK